MTLKPICPHIRSLPYSFSILHLPEPRREREARLPVLPGHRERAHQGVPDGAQVRAGAAAGAAGQPAGAGRRQFNRKNCGLSFGFKNGLKLHFDSVTCRSLMLGNVSYFVQLIFYLRWSMNQLYKNPNIAKLETSHYLWTCDV